MNYNNRGWDKFGSVWFYNNCGENPIGESDLEYNSSGNLFAYIRKTKACEPLPEIQYEPEDDVFSYNIGDGL